MSDPCAQAHAKTKPMQNKKQLEISLAVNLCGRRHRVQRVRPARAHWWFERMRRAVDAAAQPVVMASPEQGPAPLLPERKAA